jgi:hypothetical protein
MDNLLLLFKQTELLDGYIKSIVSSSIYICRFTYIGWVSSLAYIYAMNEEGARERIGVRK